MYETSHSFFFEATTIELKMSQEINSELIDCEVCQLLRAITKCLTVLVPGETLPANVKRPC